MHICDNGGGMGKNMAYDISAAMSQKTEMDKAADEITRIITRLENTRNEFLSGWKCSEVFDVETVIEDNIRRLKLLRGELQDVGHSILKNAEDIRLEEELKAKEEERLAREEAYRVAENIEYGVNVNNIDLRK